MDYSDKKITLCKLTKNEINILADITTCTKVRSEV